MIKTVTEAFSRLKRLLPNSQHSASVERDSDLADPFADYTPEQIEAFNAEARELERKHGKDYYRPQPDNYTTADFIKDIEASDG